MNLAKWGGGAGTVTDGSADPDNFKLVLQGALLLNGKLLPCPAGRVNDPRPDGVANLRFLEGLCCSGGSGPTSCGGPPELIHTHIMLATTVDVKKGDTLLVPYGKTYEFLDGLDGSAATPHEESYDEGGNVWTPQLVSAFDMLHTACSDDVLEDVDSVLKDFDVASRTLLLAHTDPHSGMTALMTASLEGHESIVKCLLKYGADPEACDKDRTTALMHAASKGFVDVVRALVNDGNANLEVRDEKGLTALLVAVDAGQSGTVAELIKLNADREARSAKGEETTELLRRLPEPLRSEVERAMTPRKSGGGGGAAAGGLATQLGGARKPGTRCLSSADDNAAATAKRARQSLGATAPPSAAAAVPPPPAGAAAPSRAAQAAETRRALAAASAAAAAAAKAAAAAAAAAAAKEAAAAAELEGAVRECEAQEAAARGRAHAAEQAAVDGAADDQQRLTAAGAAAEAEEVAAAEAEAVAGRRRAAAAAARVAADALAGEAVARAAQRAAAVADARAVLAAAVAETALARGE